MNFNELSPADIAVIAKALGSNYNNFRQYVAKSRVSAVRAIEIEHAAKDLLGVNLSRADLCPEHCGKCEYAKVFQYVTEAKVAMKPVEVRIPKTKRAELRDNEVLFGAYILRRLKEKGVPVDGALFVCGVTHGRLECRTDLDLAGETGDEYVFRWTP